MYTSDVERIDYTNFDDKLDVFLHKKRYDLASQAIQWTHILDLGCGYWFGTKQMAIACPEKTFTAIDIDPEVIAYAQEHNQLPNITYLVMSATDLTFDDNTFDSVTSLENIEHIPDDKTYIKEAARVLKLWGVLFITTPNLRRLMTRVKHFFLPHQTPLPKNTFHIREYSPQWLTALVAPYFSTVSLTGLFLNIFPWRRHYLRFTNLKIIIMLFVRKTNKHLGDYLVLQAKK